MQLEFGGSLIPGGGFLEPARRDEQESGSGKVEGGSQGPPGTEPGERASQGVGSPRCLGQVVSGA